MVRPYVEGNLRKSIIKSEVNDDINLFTGGLNTYVDKAFLEPNQMPFVMNMTMIQPPKMETRPFRLSMAEYFGGTYPFSERRVLNMYMNSKIGLFVIYDNNSTAELELFKPDGNVWVSTSLGSLGSSDEQYNFCHCWQATADYIYITTETAKYKYVVGAGSVTSIQDGFYGIPEFHKGRLFLANPLTNTVTFSALYDFDNFTQETLYAYIPNVTTPDLTNADTNYVYLVDYDDASYTQYRYVTNQWYEELDKLPKADVNIMPDTNTSIPDYSVIAGDFKVTNTIGNIVGMKSFDDKLYIFCNNSMHLLYGSTPDPSLSNTFQLVDLNNGIGAYSNRCICVGSDFLFWLGNDKQIYQHTGSYTYMISRPTEKGTGGVDNLFNFAYIGDTPQMAATNSRLYFNVPISIKTWERKNTVLLVYDIYNKIWWAEDGEFTSITDDKYDPAFATLFMARLNGDVLFQTIVGTGGEVDEVYDFEQNKIVQVPIKYEFQTRIYGAEGVDTRKTISDIWFQARANASVYLGDLWTAKSHWDKLPWDDTEQLKGYVKVGELKYVVQAEYTDSYDPNKVTTPTRYYEQQRAIVPKMFGQRVNAFSVFVKGEGKSEFFLAKRNWRVS